MPPVLTYILIGLLIVSGIFLVVAVLLQQGKSKGGLSGTIVGGTETFYGKEHGIQRDKFLSRLTTIAAIVFVVIVLIVYIVQPDFEYDYGNQSPVAMIINKINL